MKNLEAIKNLRNRIMVEGYEDDIEYDYRFFEGCVCMLENLNRKMSHLVDCGIHNLGSKEELKIEYKALEKEYNKLYEDLKPYMNVAYNGYKAYSERCYKRYSNVIDFRHGEDYYLNKMADEAFNN